MSIFRYIPVIETISTYKKEYLRDDLIAAATVAIVALPQSMAYALIAGLDPAYGLYSAVVLVILGAVFGSSNHLTTGPTNAISLLVAANMARYVGKDNFFEMLFLLTFMVGAIQFLMGVLKLGRLVNYVSHSVIVGFTAGAGVIIALGQLNSFLGVKLPQGNFSTLEKVFITFQNLNQINYYSFSLAVIVLLMILILRKINPAVPGALIGIIFSVVIVMIFDFQDYGVKLTGEIPSAIPPLNMVNLLDFQAMSQLVNGAIAIALIGLVEAVSISKAISSMTGQKIDPNQEFIGQGIANMGGSFLSCYAGSGSFTRSAVTFQSGGKTRLAPVISGIIVLITLVFLAPFARFIPISSLAAVLMVVAYSMVDKKAVRKVLTSSKNDAFILLVTFFATVLAPELEYAIYSGIALSVILYLRETGTVRINRLVPVPGAGGGFVEVGIGAGQEEPGSPVSIIQIEGNLYFGSAADLENKLESSVNESRVLILRFKGVSVIDVTSLDIIETFIHKMLKENRKVMLYGVNSKIRELLERAQIISLIGAENVFRSEDDLFVPVEKTLDKVKSYESK